MRIYHQAKCEAGKQVAELEREVRYDELEEKKSFACIRLSWESWMSMLFQTCMLHD